MNTFLQTCCFRCVVFVCVCVCGFVDDFKWCRAYVFRGSFNISSGSDFLRGTEVLCKPTCWQTSQMYIFLFLPYFITVRRLASHPVFDPFCPNPSSTCSEHHQPQYNHQSHKHNSHSHYWNQMRHPQAHPVCEVDARASHHRLKWLSHTLLLKVKCWP